MGEGLAQASYTVTVSEGGVFALQGQRPNQSAIVSFKALKVSKGHIVRGADTCKLLAELESLRCQSMPSGAFT